jgi:hypothetical protein
MKLIKYILLLIFGVMIGGGVGYYIALSQSEQLIRLFSSKIYLNEMKQFEKDYSKSELIDLRIRAIERFISLSVELRETLVPQVGERVLNYDLGIMYGRLFLLAQQKSSLQSQEFYKKSTYYFSEAGKSFNNEEELEKFISIIER